MSFTSIQQVACLISLLAPPAFAARGIKLQPDPATGAISVLLPGTDGDAISIGPLRMDGMPQSGFTRQADDLALSSSTLRVELEAGDADWAAIRWIPLDGAVHDLTVPVSDNSNYYGCGERFHALNQKGSILPMASIDRPEAKGVVSYKPVPFYMSTRGYAVWVDSSAPGSFDLNATDRERVLLRYRSTSLRLVLIRGSDPAAMLDVFTRLTGRPRVPPVWSFAPWKSRDVHASREDVLADAELSRRHDLPGSVIVIDSPWETGYNDFVLNEAQFTEPAAMFRRVEALGFYPCFWLTPFVNLENRVDMNGIKPGPSRNYAEGREAGYFVRRPDGEPMIASWWKGRGALVDFTRPEAVNWWHDQIDQARGWGLHALKCDDGEGNFVQDAVFFDGTPAAEMKSRYAALYLEAAQAYVDDRLDGDGVLLARSGFTGAQRQPFGWAGDNEANFSFDNGLPGVILAGQNAALSGLPFWGSDIAGYIGRPSKELFIRWTQFGALSPLMMVHMTSNLGPWDFDDETLAIYRDFARLHTRLAPYLLEAAHESADTGMPIIRPMVLAFPGDRAAAVHRYQYLFGPDLLVAPMYQPGAHRAVYLPERPPGSSWVDYWSGEIHAGGQLLDVHAPLRRMPLFVRRGAMLCVLPDDVDTLIARHDRMLPDVVAMDARRVIEVWPGRPDHLTTVDGITARATETNGAIRLTLTSTKPRVIEVRRMYARDPGSRPPSRAWHAHSTDRHLIQRRTVGPEPVTMQWMRP